MTSEQLKEVADEVGLELLGDQSTHGFARVDELKSHVEPRPSGTSKVAVQELGEQLPGSESDGSEDDCSSASEDVAPRETKLYGRRPPVKRKASAVPVPKPEPAAKLRHMDCSSVLSVSSVQ